MFETLCVLAENEMMMRFVKLGLEETKCGGPFFSLVESPNIRIGRMGQGWTFMMS